MIEATTVKQVREIAARWREERCSVGFVPTMGALHQGHISLVECARQECDRTVLSIFVNPTQFAPGEDFERYPRPIERDRELAEAAGVDLLFRPEAGEMYPPSCCTFAEVPGLSDLLDGAIRPGHFRGVATVCAKLFNIVQPDRAYFGVKDYQQLKIIQRMVADLRLPLTVVPVPTRREADGLAMSSRNGYLDPESRAASVAIFQALCTAKDQAAEPDANPREIEREMSEHIARAGGRVDYAVIVDGETLSPLNQMSESAVAMVAARFGSARLIDNMPLFED